MTGPGNGIDMRAATEAAFAAAAADGWICAADLADKDPAPRPWLVRDWIPRRQVTLFSGHGGLGKSLIALQLCVAVASGRAWFGLETEPGPAFALWCEDEADELHRRLFDVCRVADVAVRSLNGYRYDCRTTGDVALFSGQQDDGATSAWHELRQKLLIARPRLVVLDAAGDLFDDNENDRARVRRFVRQLRGLAVELDAAIVLLSHPSRAGLAAGDGLSGSTAWHNSVRSRLLLEDTKDEDPDRRELWRPKSNYAGRDDSRLVLRRDPAGAFVIEGRPGLIDRQARTAQADRVFATLLRRMLAEGFDLHPVTGRGYGPAAMAERPDAEGMTAKELAAAMQRAITAGKAVIVERGPPSKRRKFLSIPEAVS